MDDERCPHCKRVCTDLWDFDWGSREIIETECGHCEAPIAIVRHESVVYQVKACQAWPVQSVEDPK